MGLSAPKGTSDEIVKKVNAALQLALKNPASLRQLLAEGLTPMYTTPEQYTRLVRSDAERWGQLVRSLNIKAN